PCSLAGAQLTHPPWRERDRYALPKGLDARIRLVNNEVHDLRRIIALGDQLYQQFGRAGVAGGGLVHELLDDRLKLGDRLTPPVLDDHDGLVDDLRQDVRQFLSSFRAALGIAGLTTPEARVRRRLRVANLVVAAVVIAIGHTSPSHVR